MNHSFLKTLAACALLLTSSATSLAQEIAQGQEARITLTVVETDVRDALRLVAQQGDIDLVMSNAVNGTVSLELKDASLKETLDAISDIAGLEYFVSGDIVTVSTLAELLERQKQREEFDAAGIQPVPAAHEVLVVELDYVDASRVLPVIERLLGEGGSASLLKTSDHVAQNVSEQDNQGQDSSGLQIGTRLATTTQGQPAKSHTIVVVDSLEVLARVKQVVDRIDRKPEQIVIEARFVEVSLDEDEKTGINWNLVAQANGANVPHTFPFGNHTLGDYNPRVAGGGSGGVFPNAPDSISTPAEPGLFTFGALDFATFGAVLEMIQSDARIQIVSNPRIVVGDRHTATILVGERYPILSTNISEFGTVTEQLDHYEPIGVQLEVTPSVLSDGQVELFVRPSTSSLGPVVAGSTGLTVARINSRQIDTSVTTQDGRTIVLGGLITTREVDTKNQVPFLGKIPLLGNLFRHRSTETERVDLVVFLTVSILREDGLTEEEREMFRMSELNGSKGRASAKTELELSVPPPQD